MQAVRFQAAANARPADAEPSTSGRAWPAPPPACRAALPPPPSARRAAPPPARAAPSSAPAAERAAWVSSVRSTVGRQKHRLWGPHLALDPPPLLGDVAVVLVSPKRPSSVGAVARALSCFECVDLRLVAPRCDPLARSARNGSKGAQYLLWRAKTYDTLEDAVQGAGAAVAFTRWVDGLRGVRAHRGMAELLAAGDVAATFGAPERVEESGAARSKLVLVFGREEEGLREEEVATVGAACALPIGRLQESLSLSHAVSLALAPLFEARLGAGGGGPLAATRQDLAAGVEAQDD